VLDPSARFLYVVDQTSPRVFVYSVGAGGALTQVSGSPYFSSVSGIAAYVSPNGNFLFIGGFGSPSVDAFTIDAHHTGRRAEHAQPVLGVTLGEGHNHLHDIQDKALPCFPLRGCIGRCSHNSVCSYKYCQRGEWGSSKSLSQSDPRLSAFNQQRGSFGVS
jgi:hypothetical protein